MVRLNIAGMFAPEGSVRVCRLYLDLCKGLFAAIAGMYAQGGRGAEVDKGMTSVRTSFNTTAGI